MENNLDIEELKFKYNLQNDIICKLCSLKNLIEEKRQKSMNYNELITFLKSAMNYDERQIWFIKQQILNINITLNEELKKFFELKTNDDILILYDVEQNYNQNNLDGIIKAVVSLEKKEAYIECEENISTDDLKQFVSEVEFSCTSILDN